MTGEKGRDKNEKEDANEGENGQKVWIEADECIDGEEGECMSGFIPGEEANNVVLKHEDDPNSRRWSFRMTSSIYEASYLELKRRKLFVISGRLK